MACYKPLTAYQLPAGGPLLFQPHRKAQKIFIACQQCIGCLLEDSRKWATRCMHEARMHKYNCFLTLTFDNDHRPDSHSLDHRYYQLFVKKLREAMQRQLLLPPAPPGSEGGGGEHNRNNILFTAPVAPEKRLARQPLSVLRYYMCGEYGELNGRQHYHANMFGIDFADKKYYRETPAGYALYKSATLDKIWGQGYATIGELTWESAAYTARYLLKKAGEKQKDVEILNPDTGEIIIRKREYAKMSRNPGIGKTWLKQYYSDAYPHGSVIVNGHETLPPRYYDDYFKQLDEKGYTALKLARRAKQFGKELDLTRYSLQAGESITRAKMQFLKRTGAIE